MSIKCFEKFKVGDLENRYKNAINEGQDELEAAAKIILDYHKELFNEVELLKKEVQGKSYKPSEYVSPLKGDKLKAIEEDYNNKIKVLEESAEQQKEASTKPVSGDEDVAAEENSEQEKGTSGTVPPSEQGEEEGFKKEPGKKSLLGRAFEGESTESLKEKIAYYGLDYESQTHEEARKTAQQIIKELGIDAAVESVRKGVVQNAEAAMIWAEAIDYIGEKIANETDPNNIAELEKAEASLLNEFDLMAREKGRFISALNDIYNKSNFSYKLSDRIKRYKDKNNGEIPSDIEEKYRDLDIKYQDVVKRISEMEIELKKQAEQQSIDNIKEDYERSKNRHKGNTATEKAKQIANIIRKGKIRKPGIFLSTTPASAVWDGALEATAKALEATGIIADAIKAGVEYIKQTEWYKNLNKKDQNDAVDSFAASVQSNNNDERPFINDDGKIVIPKSVIRGYVEGGIDNINGLTEAIKQDLIEDYPNITDRQVRDAITEYGKTINPTQDEVSAQISKIKNIGRVISALEDIAVKKRPLKSGLQRRKFDAEERALQKQLREALKELPVDAEARDKQLKTTLEGIKSRLRNSIEDIEREIATGEKRAANKGEVIYDEEAKSLREERDRLKEIRDEIFGDEITDEQRISRSINITERAIENLEQKIKDNDLSFKQKQILDSPELKKARERLKSLRDTINEMREQSGFAEQRRLDAAKKRVKNRIVELNRRLNEKDFSKKAKKVLHADNELVILNAEKLAIQEEYDKEEYKVELKNRSAWRKGGAVALEVWGLPRVLMTTSELSFIFIQGGIYTISHPITAAKAFLKMWEHFGSESKFTQWQRTVRSQAYYPLLKASNLRIADYNSKLEAAEELGVSGWANHIWDYLVSPLKLVSTDVHEFIKLKNPLKAFERAGVSYLNQLRLSQFLLNVEKLKAEGKTFESHPQDFKNVADVVNTFTGRSSLGPAEPFAKHLAVALFSPRNWVSIIKQTVPIITIPWMIKLRSKGSFKPSVAQKMVVKDYITAMTATLGIVMLAAWRFNGDDDEDTEVSFDPKSTDFLKLRLGNTRIDLFGGRTQMIVFQMRLITDQLTTNKGVTKKLGEDMYTPTRMGLMGQQLQNKLAPALGLAVAFAQTGHKKDKITGQDVRMTPYNEPYSFTSSAFESSYPIFWGTIAEIHKEQPAEVEAFLYALGALGVNISTYKAKKQPTKRPTR